MTRDLVSIALIVVGLFKVWLAWLQVRSFRVKSGLWFRLPLPLQWRLAGVFGSMTVLLVALGLLIWRGNGPLPLWSLAIVANVVFWHILLAWGLAHGEDEEYCAPPAVEQEEP